MFEVNQCIFLIERRKCTFFSSSDSTSYFDIRNLYSTFFSCPSCHWYQLTFLLDFSLPFYFYLNIYILFPYLAITVLVSRLLFNIVRFFISFPCRHLYFLSVSATVKVTSLLNLVPIYRLLLQSLYSQFTLFLFLIWSFSLPSFSNIFFVVCFFGLSSFYKSFLFVTCFFWLHSQIGFVCRLLSQFVFFLKSGYYTPASSICLHSQIVLNPSSPSSFYLDSNIISYLSSASLVCIYRHVNSFLFGVCFIIVFVFILRRS